MMKQTKQKLYRVLRPILHPRILCCVDQSWSTDSTIGIKGWILSKRGAIENVDITVGDATVPITSWHARSDVTACYPEYDQNINCGFWVQLPRTAEHRASFTVSQSGKALCKSVTFAGTQPAPPTEYPDGETIFSDFVKRVNDEHLSVLEIGSRIVSPGATSRRSEFPGASSYTGFDYYPDSNTDVVGDAHQLSSYFKDKKFDAVFSIVVFEHLAMPWVVAMEINKILRVGGISCHATPFAWPAHERPFDFWRSSNEGLKVLFSSGMGFETIRSGMNCPLHMYFDKLAPGQEEFPNLPCFGGASILSRKVSEIDEDKFRWDVSLADVVGDDSHYPEKSPIVWMNAAEKRNGNTKRLTVTA